MTTTDRELKHDEQQRKTEIILLGREYGSANSHRLADLEARLLRAIDASPAGLLIDLSETVSIGCAFVDVLRRCQARARGKYLRFALCAPKLAPESVFAITRFDTVSEIFPTRHEAIEAMQRSQGDECASDAFDVRRSAGECPNSA